MGGALADSFSSTGSSDEDCGAGVFSRSRDLFLFKREFKLVEAFRA